MRLYIKTKDKDAKELLEKFKQNINKLEDDFKKLDSEKPKRTWHYNKDNNYFYLQGAESLEFKTKTTTNELRFFIEDKTNAKDWELKFFFQVLVNFLFSEKIYDDVEFFSVATKAEQ